MENGEPEAEPAGELCEEAVGEYVVVAESFLEMEMVGSVRAGDIISLSGRVVSKKEVDGLGLVECAVVVAAQEGDVGEERVIGTGRVWVALEVKGGVGERCLFFTGVGGLRRVVRGSTGLTMMRRRVVRP